MTHKRKNIWVDVLRETKRNITKIQKVMLITITSFGKPSQPNSELRSKPKVIQHFSRVTS